MAVCGLCHFLTVPFAGLWSVFVAFPDHTHLFLFCLKEEDILKEFLSIWMSVILGEGYM